jgi:hypothetical protein
MTGHALDDPRLLGRRPAPRGGRARRRLAALLALAAFFVAGIVLVAVGLGGSGAKQEAQPVKRQPRPVARPAPPPAPKPTAARPKKPAAPPIAISAVAAFDPAGDGHENDSSVSLATDGNPGTAWHTERYRTWYKPGVGIVLDAGRELKPTALTLQTDKPGFVAEVQAGPSPTGPFTRISQSATTTDTTIYRLRAERPERYLLLWITRIPDGQAADVNEVRLR